MLKNDAVPNPPVSADATRFKRTWIIGILAAPILMTALGLLWVASRQVDAKPAELTAPLIVKSPAGNSAAEVSPPVRDSAHPLRVNIPIASLSSLTLPNDADKKSGAAASENATEPVRLLASVSAVREVDEKPVVTVPLATVPQSGRYDEERENLNSLAKIKTKSLDAAQSTSK